MIRLWKSKIHYLWNMSDSLTREDIISVLRQQKDFLHKKFYVKTIGIFGSFARNEANENSDIDFLVEFEEGNLDYYMIRRNLNDFLSAEFKREVDIAISKALKPFYKDTILKQAVYAWFRQEMHWGSSFLI